MHLPKAVWLNVASMRESDMCLQYLRAPSWRSLFSPHIPPSQLRERSNRLESVEQDATLLRQQNSTLREENSALSSSKHTLERAASAREVELSALAQSIRDKDQLLASTAAHLEAAQEAKRQQDAALELYKDTISKLQEKLKASAAEITKGNEIINTLQTECRALRGKLRLKMAVLQQQQDQVAQKQQEADASGRACSELRAQLAELTAEKQRAEDSHGSCRQQLAEAQELLRSNQQVIQWLNKELNDAQTGQRIYTSGAPLLSAHSSRVGGFRPTMPPTQRSGVSSKPGFNSGDDQGSNIVSSVSAVHVSSSSATAATTGSPDAESVVGRALSASSNSTSAALSSLRSRAGLAFVESGKEAAGTTGASDFNRYLNPSNAVGMAAS